MALLRDQLEPLARDIADTLSYTGAIGSVWANYHRNQDLVVITQPSDTHLIYARATNHEARIELQDIKFKPLDISAFDIGEQIVLESKKKATDSVPFHNASSEVQDFTLSHREESGENETLALMAGFEKKVTVTAEVSAGIGIAEAKASVVDETTLKAEVNRQTGRSTSKEVGGEFTIRMPAWTAGEARLTWSEQTLQNRIKGYQQIGCRIFIGTYQDYWKKIALGPAKRHIRRWTTGSPVGWADLENLIAVLEKRGSVKDARFEYYANRNINPVHVQRLREKSRIHVDVLTDPYRGANTFRPEIVASHSLKDGAEVEAEAGTGEVVSDEEHEG